MRPWPFFGSTDIGIVLTLTPHKRHKKNLDVLLLYQGTLIQNTWFGPIISFDWHKYSKQQNSNMSGNLKYFLNISHLLYNLVEL